MSPRQRHQARAAAREETDDASAAPAAPRQIELERGCRGSRAAVEPARPRGGAAASAGICRRRSARSIWCCARARRAPARPSIWLWPGSRPRPRCLIEDELYLADRDKLIERLQSPGRERCQRAADRPQSRAARAGGGARRARQPARRHSGGGQVSDRGARQLLRWRRAGSALGGTRHRLVDYVTAGVAAGGKD